jgi:hypothetical protein
MPLDHAPSTEPFFRALQRDREREVLRLARPRPVRTSRRSGRSGRVLPSLAAVLRRLLPSRRRAVAADSPHVRAVTRGSSSHPGLGTQRSTTRGVPCPSCA